MAKAKRKRTRYTEARRVEIVATANKEGLTALQVQKKFGVTPVTYYSWRHKAGVKRGPGRPKGAVSRVGRNGDLGGQVRTEVQARVRALLPGIVRAEVSQFLDGVLGPSSRKRRRS